MTTAKERKEARQQAARERTKEIVSKAGDFLNHVYDDVKIGGNVDQAYKSAFDWLMANQDMNLKEFSEDVLSFLNENSRQPIARFFESTGKKIVEQFEKDKNGRFEWEKSLAKAFKDFGSSVVEQFKSKDIGPDIAAGAAEFENQLQTRIDNLQAIINSATPDELSELPALKLELDILRGRLLTMPDSDEPEELATWMAGTDAMPDGLRVTDTSSVRGEEKQILETAISKVKPSTSEYVNPEALNVALKEERNRLQPLPGELDRDDLVSGADDLTESERIREGLDTVVETEEEIVDETALDVDAEAQRQQFRLQRGLVTDDDPRDDVDDDADDSADQNLGNQLSDAAMQYISENFGSVEFFRQRRDLNVTKNGVTKNVIDWIIDDEEENPDVIWSLFQQTQWFAENGPAARQFQSDWFKAGGTDQWKPNYDPSQPIGQQWLNTTPDMLELLDDTYDGLILEAERIGIDTNKVEVKNAVMGMAYNAKQLNMTDYEMKNEFLTNVNLAFDPNAVKGSGTFGAIRQKLQANAGSYMLKLDDVSLDQFAQDIYLGKATYEGINAGFASNAKDMNPAIASLIDQGYTPSAYFSSYSNIASNLLGRNVDFLGGDSKMFSALTDTMVSGDGLGRPMTRGEFERYVRSTPEWDTSENARDEAYSTVDTVLNSFGIRV